MRISAAARERLRELEAGFTTTQEWEAASRLISQLDERTANAMRRLDGAAAPEPSRDPIDVDRAIRAEVIKAERAELEALRRSGEVSDRVYRHVQYNIDLLESFLSQGV